MEFEEHGVQVQTLNPRLGFKPWKEPGARMRFALACRIPRACHDPPGHASRGIPRIVHIPGKP